jgi:endonuclease III
MSVHLIFEFLDVFFIEIDVNHCIFRVTQRIELMRNDQIEHNLLTLSKIGPKDLWPSISNHALQLSSSDDTESPVLCSCIS